MIQADVDRALRAVCPINGVSFGRLNDKSTWDIQFAPEATDEQRIAARGVVDSFDIASSTTSLPAATDLDKLTDLLVAKNIITKQEANGAKVDAAVEEAVR